MLNGVAVPSQDGLECGGKLAKVVEHLQGHAHLGGVLYIVNGEEHTQVTRSTKHVQWSYTFLALEECF